MTNDRGLFFEQFSADEFYIIHIDISYLIVNALMLLITVFFAFKLKSRQFFHTTYKIYLVSLTCQATYLLIMSIYLGKFANDGIERPGVKTFARFFQSASTCFFLLLLILMGKGYTITRGRISTGGVIKITIFMTIYVIAYFILFVFENKFFDPGLVLYLYESPAGYGLIGLHILSWFWFSYAIFCTRKRYPEKSSFYYLFYLFYTFWFLAMPIFVLIAYFVIDKWVREKVVNGVENTIAFLAHLIFLILTRPSAANKNFPYHVKTTQIGVMDNAPHIEMRNQKNFNPFSNDYNPTFEYDEPIEGQKSSHLFTIDNPNKNESKQTQV
ncbi:DgyrCDS2420 [Dimorphilus gyrociliatus]|uniref:DgyrCDS2420 n=1 Tax=Dimorphilus gyrociliatus TaxID=2664684 RepID=A0A7I8VAL6_9ANNE|nr:DgyrCDS2420 [Dimorphilus gyrociliatus]